VDRRRFLGLAAAPLVLGAVPEALARGLDGLPLALVTADLEASVVAVDLARGRIYRRLRTPADPRSIESVGAFGALVAHTALGRLTLIDQGLRVHEIEGELGAPRYTAAVPGPSYAYVSDSDRSEIAVVALRRRRIVARIHVGGPVRHLSLDRFGRRLWAVLGNVAPTVAILDASRAARPRLLGTLRPPFNAHDVGFTPEQGGRPLAEMRKIAEASIEYGWRVPAVKWLMVEALFTGGVGIYGFYALQPYLLELYGDPKAYQVAGLVAAVVAGAQIVGGMAAPRIRRMFKRRTSALLVTATLSSASLALMGAIESFAVVIAAVVVWGLLFAATMPIRQAYLNGLIPSRQRATILSFDSMMTSSGGVWAQPALGRAADAWGYAPSYLIAAGISTLALPFIALSRRQNAEADTVQPAVAQPA